MVIKGKFSVFALCMHVVLIMVAVGACASYPKIFSGSDIALDDPVFYILLFIFLLYASFALISPFISIKNVYVDERYLYYRYIFFKREFLLDVIDGFFTMEIPSRDYTYETMYPVSRGRILPSISSFYMSNYEEIKKAIPVKNLGKVRFSWRNYFTVILVKKYNELKK